jgi:hypothetical protein
VTHVIYSGRIAPDKLAALISNCRFSEEALMLLESQSQRVITKKSERQNLLLFTFLYLEEDGTNRTIPALEKLLEDYTSGRVFQESGELRWEKEQGQLKVVYLGEEGELSTNVDAALRDYAEKETFCSRTSSEPSQEKKYYLFGTRLKDGEGEELEMIGPPARRGDFAEARIHRLLRYPLKSETSEGPIRLVVNELYDGATGQLIQFRFVKLDDTDEREKAG